MAWASSGYRRGNDFQRQRIGMKLLNKAVAWFITSRRKDRNNLDKLA
jgi:hypothetical protein